MDINFNLIGSRIKEIRIKRRISQEELAERADLSVSYICHIERAKKKASLTSLVSIANALGVTVDSFLNGNQKRDQTEYHPDLMELFKDCNSYEKRVIYANALALKKNLHENRWLCNKEEC